MEELGWIVAAVEAVVFLWWALNRNIQIEPRSFKLPQQVPLTVPIREPQAPKPVQPQIKPSVLQPSLFTTVWIVSAEGLPLSAPRAMRQTSLPDTLVWQGAITQRIDSEAGRTIYQVNDGTA